jgi:hypothetical protein
MVESTAKVKSENCNGILAFALLSLLCQQKIKSSVDVTRIEDFGETETSAILM